MSAWAGIALALRAPDEDALYSRLPTYLHPLAGRSVAWHLLNAIAAIRPKPALSLFLSREGAGGTVSSELEIETVITEVDSWWHSLREHLPAGIGRLLIVDAAAATLSTSLARLVAGPTGRALIGDHGAPLALWLDRQELEEMTRGSERAPRFGELVAGLDQVTIIGAEGVLIRDRIALARASVIIRDRIVENLLAAGVTFLIPDTVLVDIDVRIGADSVIYPGVVLEGRTTIGSETVIGPGCRIIDSWVGSGVELKGWNYISNANVRNRAVLEPYVRRGFD